MTEGMLGFEFPFLAGAGLGAGVYGTPFDYGFFGFLQGGVFGEHLSIGGGVSLKPIGDIVLEIFRKGYEQINPYPF